MPERLYRAELRYDHPAGWFVAPSVEWSASKIWVDYKNTRSAPSYAILNFAEVAYDRTALNLFTEKVAPALAN